MKRRLRFAQIGCNGVGNNHAIAHRWTGNTELVAVCDIDPAKAGDFASRYNVPRSFTSPDEVFADDSIDAIDIVTPDHTHATLALAAMRQGKHVIIEKPFASTLEEADQIIAQARTSGVYAMGVQSMRWIPKIRSVLDLVRSGTIGRPVYARVWGGCPSFWSADNWPKAASRGNIGYNLIHNGVHSMDLLCELMQDTPKQVYTVGHLGDDDVPLWQYFNVNVSFATGGMALFEENRIIKPHGYPTPGNAIQIIGEKGTINLDATKDLAVSEFTRDGWAFPGSHVAQAPGTSPFADLIREFTDAVLQKGEVPVSLAQSRRVLAAVLASLKSFETGRAEEVNLD